MTTPIDSHFHWFPRAHFEKMAARQENPRTERVGDGYNYRFNDGDCSLPLPAAWFDLELGIAEAERVTGPDTVVVCTSGVTTGLLDMLPAKTAIDLAAEWNAEIGATQARLPGKFVGTASIPLQNTEAALELIDHAILELGLKGINLPALTAGEPIDVARLDPFYARVAELGVPLIIHPTDFAYSEVLTGYDGAIHRTMGRLIDSSVTVMRLIFSGILERYPDLKVLHTHGGGILPHQVGRLDKNARIAGLPEKPSVYLRKMSVDTVAPQSSTIRTALEFYGDDQVLYGTDYPCWHPQPARETIQAIELTEEQDDKVMGANAEAFFALQSVGAPLLKH